MTLGTLALILIDPAVLFIITAWIWMTYVDRFYDSFIREFSIFLCVVVVFFGIAVGLVWLIEHQNIILW